AEPFYRRLAKYERGVAQRLGTPGKNELGDAVLDVAISGVERLHARAAIDLHGERRHPLTHAETKRGDARRVHLIGDHVDAAEDQLVEGIGRKRLAQEQRPPTLDGKIDRRERTGTTTRLEKRRAGAVDDVDGSHQLALAAGVLARLIRRPPAGMSSSGAKSST